MQKLNGDTDQTGGPSYLASLTSIVPSLFSANSYCSIVKNTALSRKMIAYGQGVAAKAPDGEVPESLIDQASTDPIAIAK